MRNFSEINDINLSQKDHIISDMVSKTGLPQNVIDNLYNGFSMQHNNDLKKINESFIDFINPKTFDYNGFRNSFMELSKKVANPFMDEKERESVTYEILNLLEANLGVTPDIEKLFEIISFVLLVKNEKFEKIININGTDVNVITDLFESTIDLSKVNITAENTREVNNLNARADVKLYQGLRDMLARNNKRWGHNYHLDNTYNAIMSYIDEEVKVLTNANAMYSVDDRYYMELLNQMVYQHQLNPMYKNINSLKQLVPDIQTLIFDMTLFVNTYIQTNKWSIQFIDRENYSDFVNASRILYANILSSRFSSRLLQNPDSPELNSLAKLNDGENDSQSEKLYGIENPWQPFHLFQIDRNKFDFENFPIRISTASDAIQIIKACESEVNMKVRKSLNNYFTKAMNLIAKTEKILLKQRETTKYKSGY